ncbi:hypothetical protein ACQWHL_24530, partial [Salmonella enterica subsp. enterica serovar Infantis]
GLVCFWRCYFIKLSYRWWIFGVWFFWLGALLFLLLWGFFGVFVFWCILMLPVGLIFFIYKLFVYTDFLVFVSVVLFMFLFPFAESLFYPTRMSFIFSFSYWSIFFLWSFFL